MKASATERRTILRELQRTWHPDKNPDDRKEVATAVFQYINAVGPEFLAAPAGVARSQTASF
jgi:DnaJ-class molecular chaperone